jgi:hypothetical protein
MCEQLSIAWTPCFHLSSAELPFIDIFGLYIEGISIGLSDITCLVFVGLRGLTSYIWSFSWLGYILLVHPTILLQKNDCMGQIVHRIYP